MKDTDGTKDNYVQVQTHRSSVADIHINLTT